MNSVMARMRIGRCLFAAVAALAATVSCGDVVRDGRSPVLLVMDSLAGAPGGGHGAGTFTGTLQSDVIVFLTSPAPCTPEAQCPTVFSDSGQAVLRLVPKDISVAPTPNNAVTITRYRISFRRADGRNTPGVDVPYGYTEHAYDAAYRQVHTTSVQLDSDPTHVAVSRWEHDAYGNVTEKWKPVQNAAGTTKKNRTRPPAQPANTRHSRFHR